jgi:hypothetical protein
MKQLPVLGFDATEFRHGERANEPEECSDSLKDFYGAPNSRAVEHEILPNA